MASLASFISVSLHPLHHSKLKPFSATLHKSISFVNFNFTKTFPNSTTRVFASIPNSQFNQDSDSDNSRSKKSVLFDLIQDIEPLDVSLIQKDVSHTTIDAMKRTISGMLGVLPSDQFQVTIESLWDSLFKLLISSMMTGYTLRNAEYRLCLERNLDIHSENMGNSKAQDSKQTILDDNRMNGSSRRESSPMLKDSKDVMYDIPDFGEMTPDAREYILKLHSSLSSAKKELYEVKRKNAALQMQQFVGEEKNDLLDYLRSLPPEKVAELSEPTSTELKDTIHSVVHGLLATLSPKMHSKGPDVAENSPIGMVDAETEVDIVEDTSLIFQPLISLPRDYLARLLFWCMLLGHYLRGLEYRCELMEVLSLSHDDDGSNALSDT